jgi:hypothetical protein
MLTNAIIHFKELIKNSLPEIIDAYKAGLAREAILWLDKAEKLSLRDGDRKEIDYLVTMALILGDEAGILNEKFNQVPTQIQRRGNKTSEAGEKH